MDLKKLNKKTIAAVILTAFSIFLLNSYIYYISASKPRPQDLVLDSEWGVEDYKLIFESRIHDPEEKEYIDNLIEYVEYTDAETGDEISFYRIREDATLEEIAKLKNILYKNGFYGDLASIGREVETYQKDLLNGKLGQFLRFKFVGNIIWISLPLTIYLLVIKRKKVERWHWAVLLITFAGYLTTVKHGYNYRYQLTLMPVLLTFVLVSIYYLFELNRRSSLKIIFGLILVSFALLNIFMSFIFKLDLVKQENRVETLKETSAIESVFANYEDAVDFIEGLELKDDHVFLINNLTFFHYYTDRPGVLFWIHNDYYYTPEGRTQGFMTGKTNEEFHNFLIKELRGEYIISRKDYNEHSSRFSEYLNNFTEEIYDNGSIVIYKINPDG